MTLAQTGSTRWPPQETDPDKLPTPDSGGAK
jgi:hypothetical protein